MDQVKVYLGVAKKHHFWILAVVIIIIAIVVWMMATGSLAKTYAANKQTIESAKQSVEKAANPGDDGLLPNRSFKEKVDTMHTGLKQEVYQAWEKLYSRQAGLFHWPDMDVGRDQPYNIGTEVKPNEAIPGFARTIFNEQYVKQEWKELLEKARIRRPKGDAEGEEAGADIDDEEGGLGLGRAGVGGGNAGPVEYEGLVVWPQELRDAIVERYYTEGTPSTIKIRLAQEDYWLFESLIGVINDVNSEATDSRKAPIKKIEALDVAQWAIADSRDGASPLYTAAGPGATPATGGATANAPATGTSAPSAGAPAAGDTAGAGQGASAADASKNEDPGLLAGRYLDDQGQPVLSGQSDPYAGPYAEFKQVFVHMKLIMDHRQVPALIAACANASLPVETREVRVRMREQEGAGGRANNAMASPFGNMNPMFGGGNLEGDVETLSYDALVELSGVIYLYNVPDLAKLGTGSSGSPAKRFFGVPSVAVNVPGGRGRLGGGTAGMAGYGSGMGGPMGGGMGGPMGGMRGGPQGMQGMGMMGGMGGASMRPQGMNSMGGNMPAGGPPAMGGGAGGKP